MNLILKCLSIHKDEKNNLKLIIRNPQTLYNEDHQNEIFKASDLILKQLVQSNAPNRQS